MLLLVKLGALLGCSRTEGVVVHIEGAVCTVN